MRGFSLLGAVIAIGIAGALSLAVPVLVAANTSMRTTQIQSSQAYYSARAALEFARRQILVDGNPVTLPARNFKGSAWSLTRSAGTVQISATSGGASNIYSMADPAPRQSDCLIVGVSGVTLDTGNNNRLLGVTLSRTAGCNTTDTTVTVVSMVVSWTSDSAYRLKTIRINGTNRYNNATGRVSGSLFPFTSNFSLTAATVYSVNWLQWNNITSASQITMIFNLSDGTTKTAVAN